MNKAKIEACERLCREFLEREKRREQAVMCGNITVYRREQWAGPIPEPEE